MSKEDIMCGLFCACVIVAAAVITWREIRELLTGDFDNSPQM